jgi:hypothetical protein
MPQRINRGDAEAVLNAFGTGGRVILANGQTVDASPADDKGTHGSIRPFAGSPWDGAHFCAEDWHVILLAWFDGGDKGTFNRQRAEEIIAPVTFSFTLDAEKDGELVGAPDPRLVGAASSVIETGERSDREFPGRSEPVISWALRHLRPRGPVRQPRGRWTLGRDPGGVSRASRGRRPAPCAASGTTPRVRSSRVPAPRGTSVRR